MHGIPEYVAPTADVVACDKIEHWAQTMKDTWEPITILPKNPGFFYGHIRSLKCNELIFNCIRFRGEHFCRTQNIIANMKEDFYVLAFPQITSRVMTCNSKEMIFEPPNAYLFSNAIPCESHDRVGYDTFNIMIPTRTLSSLVSKLETHYIFSPEQDGKKLGLLRDISLLTFENLPILDEDEARFFENNLLNILLFTLENHSGQTEVNDTSVKLAHRKRINDFISKNLSDEFMNPDSIAQANGISVGYLHQIFKPTGCPIMETIREIRLKTAKKLLTNTATKKLSITEVAYRLGFKYPSDFSRSFKHKYGTSPKSIR